MQKDSDYLVRNRKLIVEYLTTLFKNKCILSVHFGENNNSFMTAILELDVKNSCLKFDSAPSELLNKQLLSSARVLFRAQYEGIKVSFSGKGLKKSTVDNHPAFELPIPEAIFWMQRRQFYRVKIPLSHSGSYCKITFRNEDENGETLSVNSAKFRLMDISINGFALLSTNAEFNKEFEYDKIFSECLLHLQDGPQGDICFKVMDINEMRSSTASGQLRIGCRFTDIRPIFESAVQRYMQNIELQNKNLD